MQKFYTNVVTSGNNILIREYDGEKRVNRKVHFKPTFYIKSPKTKTKFKALTGESVEPIDFADIHESKEWIGSYESTPNFPIFGNTYHNYTWIADNYPNEIDYDFKAFSAWSLDIEVEAEKGFPNVEDANERINLITFKNINTQEVWSFGLPYQGSKKQKFKTDRKNIHYKAYDTEQEMCADFLNKWAEVQPDIIMGWNCIPLNSHIWTKNEGIQELKNIRVDQKLIGSNVKNIFPKTKKNVLEITLNNGVKIKSSKDHIFPYVKLEKGKYSSLQFGRKEQAIKCEGNLDKIKKDLEKNSIFFNISIGVNCNKDCNISDECLYALGAIYTDGTLNGKNGAFYNTNQEMIDYINDYFLKYKNKKLSSKSSKKGIWYSKKNSGKRCRFNLTAYNELTHFINFIYDFNTGLYLVNKCLNLEALSKLSKRQFFIFMSGCLDGDGCVCEKNNLISFCNYNGDIEKFEELMRWNGFICGISKNRNILTIPNSFSSVYKSHHSDKKELLKLLSYEKQNQSSSDDIAYRQIGKNEFLIRVETIQDLKIIEEMCDIETDNHYFSYAGIKTHNCEFFDVPYLIKRMYTLFGEDEVRKAISPWARVNGKTINFYGQDKSSFDIFGVTILDYYRLYRKYISEPRENYKLGYIAETDLNIGKLDHEEYATFSEFYKNNWQKYVDYNIRDVELVEALDAKWKLVELLLMVAYKAKVNFEDVLSQTKVWDMLIYNYLKKEDIVIPAKVNHKKDRQYDGAYVKEPIPGMYHWLVSIDFTSLYPSIMMILNIGFETKLLANQGLTKFPISPRNMLDGLVQEKRKGYQSYIETVKGLDVTLASNGVCYSRDKKSVLSDLLERLFNLRVEYKGKLKQAKKDGDKNAEAKWDISQQAVKIILNSCYGAVGCEYFRYFDVDNAEAVTHTGQFLIQFVERELNKFLNAALKTKNKTYVVYCDTDSAYITLDELVKSVIPNETDKNKITDYLDKFTNQVLQPRLTEMFIDICKNYINGMDPKILKMNREVIADKGIWTAKKRYILNAIDIEGFRTPEPKIKMKGIEIVKASNPKFCRDRMKEAVKIILNTGDNAQLVDYIEATKKEFNKLAPYDISSPKGCNGLTQYADEKSIYGFKCPMHVRGALMYNHLLRKNGLNTKYQFIQEGEKIRYIYLKLPNPIRENVIGFNGNFPEEFGLQKYIDYEIQFEKTFLEPMNIILKAIKWNSEKVATLEKWF